MFKILLIKIQFFIRTYCKMLRPFSIGRIFRVSPLFFCCLYIFFAVPPCRSEAMQVPIIHEWLKQDNSSFVTNEIFSVDYLENKFLISDRLFNVLQQIEKNVAKFGMEGGGGFVEFGDPIGFNRFLMGLEYQFFGIKICDGARDQCPKNHTTNADICSNKRIAHLLSGALIGYGIGILIVLIVLIFIHFIFHRTMIIRISLFCC